VPIFTEKSSMNRGKNAVSFGKIGLEKKYTEAPQLSVPSYTDFFFYGCKLGLSKLHKLYLEAR